MLPPIALQTYTLRDALASDFAGVMRRVAQIGYVGVEPSLGVLGASVEKAARLFKELGLQVPSMHAALPLGKDQQEVLEAAAAFGCARVISGKGPDAFRTPDLIRKACEQFNQAAAVARAQGLAFGLHNHWWEFECLDGRTVLDIMLEHLDPDIFFQIDTYWVRVAGADPAAVIRQLGARAPLLHIKDGPGTKEAPMVAAGSGIMDFPAIARAGAGTVEWMIIEMDRCATDMMEAVEASYRYMTSAGLACGNA